MKCSLRLTLHLGFEREFLLHCSVHDGVSMVVTEKRSRALSVTLSMYSLIPTVYRALLNSAVSGTDHRIHTTKETVMSTVAQPVQEGSRAMAARHVRTRASYVSNWKTAELSTGI